MASTKETKNSALSTMDIKDLVAYYQTTGIVYKYYENLAEAARGIGSVYTTSEAQQFLNLRKTYASKIDEITREMQNRVDAL